MLGANLFDFLWPMQDITIQLHICESKSPWSEIKCIEPLSVTTIKLKFYANKMENLDWEKLHVFYAGLIPDNPGVLKVCCYKIK